jgi:DNA polymerase, archaea type
MWILDSCLRHGAVEFWMLGGGARPVREPYEHSFYLHLPDPHLHHGMVEALESRFPVEECRFQTIFGRLDGYRIGAGRAVAEAVEVQTGYAAEAYNVDVRADQRVMAEQGLFPCGYQDEDRFALDLPLPLTVLSLAVEGDPARRTDVGPVTLSGEWAGEVSGSERTVLSDLFGIIAAVDPDVLLVSHADAWIPLMTERGERYGLTNTISRSGAFKSLSPSSYWSYGSVKHRSAALIPEGRILIDTAASFTYREGGLEGVVLASRLAGISPNLASRFTPGTLISSYEVFEALARGIAVPFRKRDPERLRGCSELKAADRGGMIFQPDAGIYEDVYQIDFTSLYPTIIVQKNLSPETLDAPGRRGFLPEVLDPLLRLRLKTKQAKKTDSSYAGRDAVLKWMLVTCFGYTGYRNARFGSIEVHEAITAYAREILVRTKEIAEDHRSAVLHGIIDCLWLQGGAIDAARQAIEEEIGIPTETDAYDWIAFLPLPDGTGAANRYFGRLASGEIKVRGVAARRRDTPAYVRRMQEEMLQCLSSAAGLAGIAAARPCVEGAYRRYLAGIAGAEPADLAVCRRISRLNYGKRCLEGSAVQALQASGVPLQPGMEIAFVVRDADRHVAGRVCEPGPVDRRYYARLLEKAYREIAFVLDRAEKPAKV